MTSETTKDYASYSYWLEASGDDLTPRAPLNGSVDVDVAILGAGYSGLWTAYYLLKRDPSLNVAIVEAEIAGFGASGRNGGFLSGRYPVPAGWLRDWYGRTMAHDLMQEMCDTVDEVKRVCDEEDMDIDFQKGGAHVAAFYPFQMDEFAKSKQLMTELGMPDYYEILSKTEANDRVAINNSIGALYSPHCAVIQPAKLARQLARVIERMGGTIYEQTRVTDYESGENPRLMTARGDVRAKTIVLCGEAYLAMLPKTKRAIMPAFTQIVLTEPLSSEQWDQIGWRHRETVSTPRNETIYLSKTTDGRIAFGGRGTLYQYGSDIQDEYDRDDERLGRQEEMTREWFPMLKDVRFTHRWGGPVGLHRDWTPTINYNPDVNLATARGYTGTGVGTANLAGRALADMITGAESNLTRLPIRYRSPKWEPEPVRWFGVRMMHRDMINLDRYIETHGKPPPSPTLGQRLVARP